MDHKCKNTVSRRCSWKKPFHARLRSTSNNKRRRERANKLCVQDIIDGEIRCITIKILMMKYVCKTKRCAYNAKLCVKMLSSENFGTLTHPVHCSLFVDGAWIWSVCRWAGCRTETKFLCFQKPKIATHFFNQIRLRAMKYKHTSACFIAVDSRPERASKQAKVIDALIEFYRWKGVICHIYYKTEIDTGNLIHAFFIAVHENHFEYIQPSKHFLSYLRWHPNTPTKYTCISLCSYALSGWLVGWVGANGIFKQIGVKVLINHLH